MNYEELVKTDFKVFIAAVAGDYFEFAPHHDLILQKVQDWIDGKILRLMISLPPRAGKSEICSRLLPAFLLGREDTRMNPIMLTSYGLNLTRGFGKDVRRIMDKESYRRIFPDSKLIGKSQNGLEFETEAGGSFFGTSVGGVCTGKSGTYFIADDTVKDLKEASNMDNLKSLQSWWSTVFYARSTVGKNGHAPRFLVLSTRWASEDLPSWLESKEGDKWEIINIPALAMDDDPLGRKPGESIWEERYSSEFYESIKNLDPVSFSKVYQGQTTCEDGNYFNVKSLTYYEPQNRIRTRGQFFIGMDTASETHGNADYSVITVWFQDKENNIWLWEMVRDRLSIIDLYQTTVNLYRKYRPLFTCIEKASSGLALLQMLNSQNPEIKTIELKPNLEHAVMQAKPILETDKVKLLADSSLMEEFASYPTGRHDDIVSSVCNFIGWWSNSRSIGLIETLGMEDTRQRRFVTKKKRGRRVPTFNEVVKQVPRYNRWKSL